MDEWSKDSGLLWITVDSWMLSHHPLDLSFFEAREFAARQRTLAEQGEQNRFLQPLEPFQLNDRRWDFGGGFSMGISPELFESKSSDQKIWIAILFFFFDSLKLVFTMFCWEDMTWD